MRDLVGFIKGERLVVHKSAEVSRTGEIEL
jgi:hypothetical protein